MSAALLVIESLRFRILKGLIPEGERITQESISQEFEVSQTIVREAFRKLAEEGLLEALPRRGVRVTKLNSDEVYEITTLRSLVEPQALSWALPNLSPNDLESAESALYLLNHNPSIDETIRHSRDFHNALYSPCRMKKTLAIIHSLRSKFERYLRFVWEKTDYHTQSHADHEHLLHLCEHGNVESAKDYLKQHIEQTGKVLIQHLSP